LHGNDRISQIIGFRPIPCAVVAKLESPNVVQAGAQYFHLLAIHGKTGYYTIIHLYFQVALQGGDFPLIECTMTEMAPTSGSPDQTMGHRMGICEAKTCEQWDSLVGTAVLVGIFQQEQFRALCYICAVFIRKNALWNGKAFGPNGGLN